MGNNDFIIKSKAQKQLIKADWDGINEVLMTGPGGTGKTVSLILSSMGPQKDGSFLVKNPSYVGLILRREGTQLEKSGLIRTALWLYKKFFPKLEYNGSLKRVTFPSGAVISFGGCEMEDDALKYKGFSKLHFLGIEEGTQFTQRQLDILITRLRDAEGKIPLRVRITTNAGENEEPLLNRYKYWLYQSCVTPLNPPIEKEYGTILYRYIDETNSEYPTVVTDIKPEGKHETFMCIETKVDDIMSDNVQTLGKITDPVLREQLLNHVWGLKIGSATYFKETDFFISTKPIHGTRIRYWDKACSGESGDYLAGVLISHYINSKESYFLIEDIILEKPEPKEVMQIILNAARKDSKDVFIGLEQEPGSSGKELSDVYKQSLEKEGFRIIIDTKKESKLNRVIAIQSLLAAKKIGYIYNKYTIEMLKQCTSFPSGKNDDVVDGITGGIHLLRTKLPYPVISRQVINYEDTFKRVESIRQI